MLEYIRTHRRLMQFVLLLFILPSFVFFGIEGYSGFRDRGDNVAKVAGQTITQQELDAAQRSQMERLRQMLGDQFDPRMLDTPAARQNILEGLIVQRAIAAEADRNNLHVDDQTLQKTILNIPGLIGPDGKFNMEQYKSLLAMQRMTPSMFEAQLRRDLALEQVRDAVLSTAFSPKTLANRLSDLNAQQREVQSLLFKAEDYAKKVNVTDDMLRAYYDSNQSEFEVPEQIKAEYVVLDNKDIAAQISVSDEDIQAYYQQNMSRFTEEEQRRARHILIKVDEGASASVKAEARKKAEELLAEVRKNPEGFERLAKENSQDPGSAERGGDLDFFGRGMMVKSFEDAAYKLKKGEISDVVESDFGYHIIQLTDIKPGSVKSLDEVKQEIVEEIRQQKVAQKFNEMASKFNDIVYEQSDNLDAAAKKLNLKIEVVNGLMRTPNPSLPAEAPYNQPKFLSALFSDDAVKNKRNTDAVEVAPGILIAGRVVDYKPVSTKSFEEVRDIVRAEVVKKEAAGLAKQAGESQLAAAKTGDVPAGFSDEKMVSRTNGQGLSGTALSAVMKADVSKLPAYVGIEIPKQGYALYRINKVMQPTEQDVARRQMEQQQISSLLAQQEMYAYLEALKKKAKVEILQPQLKAAEEEK